MGDTKQNIILESLRLFSEKGYGEVSISDIADAVGIKGPSIYKHFSSKREIFDSIVGFMSDRYNEMASGLGIDGNDASSDSDMFNSIDEDRLVEMGASLFLFFLEDELNARFRRMLSIGRYSDSELDSIYHRLYIDLPLSYQAEIFRGMLSGRNQDGNPDENPDAMALEFYSPMLLLLMSCDTDPSRKDDAVASVEEHIRRFGRTYFGVSP